MKRPTIRDIAKTASVSHSTVSRALRNSSLVKSETVAIIRRIAEESGYRPSVAARSLVTHKTNSIGVVVTTIADPFVAEVVSGIEETANEHAYSVYLANSSADSDRELRVVRGFEERDVDGIIVTSSRVGAVYVPMLSQMRVPIVLVNNQHPAEFTHSVMIANFQASYAITRHLVQLGHKRIAYIGDRFGYQSDTDRFGGYRAALDESDLPFTPEYVVHGDSKPESGRAAAEGLLRLPLPPTAIFCYNDMTALGVLRAIRMRGLSCPGDVSVAGFDDLFLAQYTDPPLTTIRQPRHEMGRLAMDTLLKLMSGAAFQQNTQVPGELILRESTAPPKAAETA